MSAAGSAPRRGSRARRAGRALVVLLVLGALARLWLAPVPDPFAAGPGLERAIALAREEGRPVVAVATSDFCLPCQRYKRGALADERVRRWIAEHAVPSFTRIEWESAEAERLGRANGPVPATMLLEGERVVATLEGACDADELLAWLDAHGRPPAAAR